MPYELAGNCVMKKGGGKVKCHKTHAEAVAHMKALYANVEDAKDWPDNKLLMVAKNFDPESVPADIDEKCWPYQGDYVYVPWGITTFADLEQSEMAQEQAEEIRETTNKFKGLVDNIVGSWDIKDKAAAINKLASEFAAKIKSPKVEKEAEPEMVVWKDAVGQWRWKGVYSNKFKDRDKEILSEKAHENFAKMIDLEIVPAPELWIWHTPQASIGKAERVWYDKETGLAHSEGIFNPGSEAIAESLSTRTDLGMSHGMPISKVIRNAEDPSIFDAYVSREVSVLPKSFAANLLTEFSVGQGEELKMSMSDDKKKFLREVGYSDETIDREFAVKATEEPIVEKNDVVIEEKKEEIVEEVKTEVVEEVKEEVKEEVAPVVEEPKVEAEKDYYSKQETFEALSGVVNSVKELQGLVTSLTEEVKAFKVAPVVEQKDLKDALGVTPPASLTELLSKSATVAPETKVDGRTKLGQDAPEGATKQYTGIRIVDAMINNSRVVQ